MEATHLSDKEPTAMLVLIPDPDNPIEPPVFFGPTEDAGDALIAGTWQGFIVDEVADIAITLTIEYPDDSDPVVRVVPTFEAHIRDLATINPYAYLQAAVAVATRASTALPTSTSAATRPALPSGRRPFPR